MQEYELHNNLLLAVIDEEQNVFAKKINQNHKCRFLLMHAKWPLISMRDP